MSESEYGSDSIMFVTVRVGIHLSDREYSIFIVIHGMIDYQTVK